MHDEATEGGVLFLLAESSFIIGAECFCSENLCGHPVEVSKTLLAHDGLLGSGCSDGFRCSSWFVCEDWMTVLNLVIEG